MEDEEFYTSLKKSLEYKKIKEEKIKEVSKTRLYKVAKKKIQTTMIGSLAAVEKYFGFLWGNSEEYLTPQQKQMRLIFEELRSEILDKGNTQVRNLENEFVNYDIVWKKNTIFLPFKGEQNND